MKRKKRSLYSFFLGTVWLFSSLLILSAVWFILSFLESNGLIEDHKLKISDFVQATVSILSTLIALVTVFLAYRSTRFVQKASEGELYIEIMKRYTSEDMVNALRLLGSKMDYFHANPQNIEKWWSGVQSARQKNANSEKLNASDIEVLSIEQARHTIKYFYRDLMQLCQGEYFSLDVAKRVCNTGGRHIFKKIVLPMEPYVNQYRYEGEFDPFDEIYDELENSSKRL